MKKHLITGLVILMPLALTLMVILFFVDFFTTPFIPIVSSLLKGIESTLNFQIPQSLTFFVARIFALFLLSIFILVLGALTRWFFMKSLLDLGDKLISKIPFLKTIYNVSKDIFSALFSTDGKKVFQHAIIAPFPFNPSYSLGFRAGEVTEEIQKKVGEPLVSIFLPTAPHPISGFLFFVPEKDAPKVDMTTEEAVKFLVSCGMIFPGDNNAS